MSLGSSVVSSSVCFSLNCPLHSDRHWYSDMAGPVYLWVMVSETGVSNYDHLASKVGNCKACLLHVLPISENYLCFLHDGSVLVWGAVRVQPHTLSSAQLWSTPINSKALLCTLMHYVLDSAQTVQCCTAPCIHLGGLQG